MPPPNEVKLERRQDDHFIGVGSVENKYGELCFFVKYFSIFIPGPFVSLLVTGMLVADSLINELDMFKFAYHWKMAKNLLQTFQPFKKKKSKFPITLILYNIPLLEFQMN